MSTTMIWAYANRRSVSTGETVDLHISSPSGTAVIEIVRDGARPAVVFNARATQCGPHAVPVDAVENGCRWPTSLSVHIDAPWESGVYLVRCSDVGLPPAVTAFFVVRAHQQKASRLLVLSTATYNAYNGFGGANAYSATGPERTIAASRLSFLRPLVPGFLDKGEFRGRLSNGGRPSRDIEYFKQAAAAGLDSNSAATGWSNWERDFVVWAEQKGLDLDYATSEDLATVPDLLRPYSLVLSVGHDEYWSWTMRDAVETHISASGNVAFLSGNTCFWQVRFDHAAQAMTIYKDWRNDPLRGTSDERLLTTIWQHPLIGRPENTMTGLSFAYGGYARIAGAVPGGCGGFTVYRPEHWVFEGTGLHYGDALGAGSAVVGYECDGCRFTMVDGLPQPLCDGGTPQTLQILALSPAQLWSRESAPPSLYPPGKPSDLEMVALFTRGSDEPDVLREFAHGHAMVAIYERGGVVFNAGVTDWVCGLAERDAVIERVTMNVLERLSSPRAAPQAR